MRFKLQLILTIGLFIAGNNLFASGHVKGYRDPLKVTFIKNPGQKPDYAVQQQLRQSPVWKKFLNDHGHWNVIYDENSAMPYRAFGKPIAVPGSDPTSTAMNFLSANLGEFNIPLNNLEFRSAPVGPKYLYVNYKQV